MKKYIFFILLVLSSHCAYCLDVGNGVGINSSNEDELWNTSLPYAIARQGLRSVSDDDYIVAFMDFNAYVLGLSSQNFIIKVNKAGRILESKWQLEPWAYNHQPKEILNRSAEQVVDVGDFSLGDKYSVGCYAYNPLATGDFENDNISELIVFIGNTLVVFSPKFGRTIFSTWMSLNDWFHPEDGKFYFEDEYGENIKQPEDPQFESRLVHRRGPETEHAPGYRGYSKIYVGDFDKDSNPDILVWRKIYISKLESDATRGFTLLRNEWNHYERDLTAQNSSGSGVTGEYLPQSTGEITIRKWLNDNNFTWKNGFPDISKCVGDEGKPIPEMSDSLLNDPEVLQ